MAGVVALMVEASGGALTPAWLDTQISSGAITEDIGPLGRDNDYGYGLIDARLAVDAAVALAGGTPTDDPTLRVNPSALSFGTSQNDIVITVSNGGGGTLDVNAPTDDAAWLTVSSVNIDASGLGTYNANVDRSALSDGTYSATITITSSTGGVADVTIPVLMTKGVSVVSDTGYQFILLIDPATLDTVEQVELRPSNGVYNYRFPNVTTGFYWVIGGTDLDNDGFICHGGEACGAYPTLDQPQAQYVNRRITGLNFGTGFVVDIGAQSASAGGVLSHGGFRLLRKAEPSGKSLGARD